MTARESDCARLAAAMPGWKLDVYERLFGGFPPGVRFLVPRTAPESSGVYSLHIPAPDAPLGDRMRFVGELAEALGVRLGRASEDLAWEEWTVVFRVQIGHSEGGAEYEVHEGSAPDLAHAAVRAAIAAKGATHGS